MKIEAGRDVVKRLCAGEIVDLDESGILVRAAEGELAVGDNYIGARNTVNLLTVSRIVYEDNIVGGYVIPTENAYAFDLWDCFKVEIVSC